MLSRWVAAASIVIVIAGVRTGGQTQVAPPRTTETITVTARESTIIAKALNTLHSSHDPLVATTVADKMVALSTAMAASGRLYLIGPLTAPEQRVVSLTEDLTKRSVEGGPIRIQVRGPESQPTGLVYTLTRSSFISFCADVASIDFIEIRTVQENKMIVAARMVLDLNGQLVNALANPFIAEREILAGVLQGFENRDRKGVIIGRVVDIADAIAATGVAYDLVPPQQAAEFHDIGHMDVGIFKVALTPQAGMVNVRYDGQTYTTSGDHFVWFFLRFLLAENHSDANTRARHLRLGGQLLDYLVVQLQTDAFKAPPA
jgi:hypothetical protein